MYVEGNRFVTDRYLKLKQLFYVGTTNKEQNSIDKALKE